MIAKPGGCNIMLWGNLVFQKTFDSVKNQMVTDLYIDLYPKCYRKPIF